MYQKLFSYKSWTVLDVSQKQVLQRIISKTIGNGKMKADIKW